MNLFNLGAYNPYPAKARKIEIDPLVAVTVHGKGNVTTVRFDRGNRAGTYNIPHRVAHRLAYLFMMNRQPWNVTFRPWLSEGTGWVAE